MFWQFPDKVGLKALTKGEQGESDYSWLNYLVKVILHSCGYLPLIGWATYPNSLPRCIGFPPPRGPFINHCGGVDRTKDPQTLQPDRAAAEQGRERFAKLKQALTMWHYTENMAHTVTLHCCICLCFCCLCEEVSVGFSWGEDISKFMNTLH